MSSRVHIAFANNGGGQVFVYSHLFVCMVGVTNMIINLIEKACFNKQNERPLVFRGTKVQAPVSISLLRSLCNFSHQPQDVFSFCYSFFILIISFTFSLPFPMFFPAYICQAKVLLHVIYYPTIF